MSQSGSEAADKPNKVVPPPIPAEYLSLTQSRRGTANKLSINPATFTPPTPTNGTNTLTSDESTPRPPALPGSLIPPSPRSGSITSSTSPSSPTSPFPSTNELAHLSLNSTSPSSATAPPLPPRKPKFHSASPSGQFPPMSAMHTAGHSVADTPSKSVHFPPPPPTSLTSVKQRASMFNKTMPPSMLAAALAAGDPSLHHSNEDSKESSHSTNVSRAGTMSQRGSVIANGHGTVSFVNRISHSSVFNNLFFVPPTGPPGSHPSVHPHPHEEKEEQPVDKRPTEYDFARAKQIFAEMVETETRFVQHLRTLCTVFIEPCQKAAESSNSHLAGSLVQSPQVQVFFSTACQILALNTQFSDELNSCTFDEQTRVGEMFLRYAPLFKCYGSYASSHEAVSSMLLKDKDFRAFTEKCSTDPQLKGQTLESLLIMPIQRVPRYRLLLEELRRRTPSDHCGYESLLGALSQVNEAARHINESIRQRENRDKLAALQASFIVSSSKDDPELISKNGSDHGHPRCLLRSGMLSRVTRRGKTDYYFHLFNDLLLYSEQSKAGFKLHKRIELNNLVTVSERPSSEHEPFALLVSSPQKTFVVCCANQIERDAWMKSLCDALALCQSSGSSFDAEDDYRNRSLSDVNDAVHDENFVAPLWTSDASQSHCSLCKDAFTFFNRRHHCRSCGVLCCGACSANKMVIAAISSTEMVRVCDRCHSKIEKRPDSPSRSERRSILHRASTSVKHPFRKPDTGHSHAASQSMNHLNSDWKDKLEMLREDASVDDTRLPAISELLLTESAYLNDLHALSDMYIKPLLRMIESTSAGTTSMKNTIKNTINRTGELGSIDGKRVSPMLAVFLTSLEPLSELNGELMRLMIKSLDDYQCDATMIGELFNRYANLFPLYVNYARNQCKAVEMLMTDFNTSVRRLEEDAKWKIKAFEKERNREESRRGSRFDSRLRRYNEDDEDEHNSDREDGDEDAPPRVSFDPRAIARAALKSKHERDQHMKDAKIAADASESTPASPQVTHSSGPPAVPPPIPASHASPPSLTITVPPAGLRSPPALPPRPLATPSNGLSTPNSPQPPLTPLSVPDISPHPLSEGSGCSTPTSNSHSSSEDPVSFMPVTKTSHTLLNLTLAPSRRIGHYVMLLSNLLEVTPQNHPDYPPLQSALNSIKAIWTDIQVCLVEGDNYRAMRTIQKHFVPSSLKEWPVSGNEHRRVVLQRTVMHRHNPGKHHDILMVWLLSDALVVGEESQKGLKLYRWYDLREIQVVESGVVTDSKSKNAFTYQLDIMSQSKPTLSVCLSDEAVRQRWLTTIKSQIKEVYTKPAASKKSPPAMSLTITTPSHSITKSSSKSNLESLFSPLSGDEITTPLQPEDGEHLRRSVSESDVPPSLSSPT